MFKQDPYEDINFVKKQCIITNNKGEKIFDEEIEFPDDFDDNCAAIVASRYLCNNAKLKETSIKQMIDRVSDTIAYNGIQNKYFLNEELKTQFANKLKYYQIHRYFAFNSPVYFNVGLQETPQSSACFILSIDDTMDSIFETTKLESRIFKNGSGSGMNLSNLRSNKETLSSGGFASGPVSFLKVMDTSAGVIRSGGTLRRSAKLGCLNDTHPDIEEFIDCKVYEELKLEILREAKLPNRPGYDLNDEIFYQNTNLSVQASNDFMNAAINNSDWSTKFRNGEICKTYKAQELLMKMAENCWKMADPGLQFSDTINKFNTVKNDGKIKSSNPCGEYLFLDDSSCNLASLNLIRFFSLDEYGNIVFDIESFIDVIQTVITAQDILIDFSSFPSEKIKENSINYRPLGLGYTNLGALLTWLGLPYDSDDGRFVAGLLTGLMQGYALTASNKLTGYVGRFNRFDDNKLSYFDVIREHAAASGRLNNEIQYIKNDLLQKLKHFMINIWDEIITNINLDDFSLRNAQVSVIAPTGTISFLMNAQTTGCEPEFAHVRYKTLSSSDGAQIKIISPIIKESLENLKYSDFEVDYIINYLIENETLEDCKYIKPEHLAIFDTSMKSGHSNRVINWHAHLSMLAAIQPFVSGGISKTISVPEDFTAQQIYNVFIESWKLGIKSLTLYRDNSKSFQPISTKKSTDVKTIEVIQPKRNKLPNDRDAKTHAFKIGNVKGYLTAGFYPDTNKLGEIFINISKEGSTLSGFADSLATIISIALQYNVPLKEFVRKLSHVKFEPNGFTDNPDIRIAHSLIDYIFRFLGLKYLSKEDQKDLGLLVNKLDVEEILDDLQIAEEVIKKDYDSSPICSDCGGIMIRKGTCYTCTNCAVNNGSCG